ncbi:MAG: hypothetical protein ACKV22_12895 [Bryobacteraceae bacterium]
MITPGTILIDKEAPRPQCFHLQHDPFPGAWISVKHNLSPRDLEQELSTTGWTFLYMANAIRATAFGFDRERMINAALKRVIANVREQRCNCLEIDDVATHSFLGVPYVNVSAHARHIQKGNVYSGQ